MPRRRLSLFFRQAARGGWPLGPIDYAAAEESDGDRLLREMRLEYDYDAVELEILEELIGNLDAWGFLKESAIAIAKRVGATEKQVHAIRCDLQNFDACGIGSCDFMEFLRFQLAKKISSDGGEIYRQCMRAIGPMNMGGDFIRSMRRLQKTISEPMFAALMECFGKNILRIHPRDPESGDWAKNSGTPDICASITADGTVKIDIPSDIGEADLAMAEQSNKRWACEFCAAMAMRQETLRKIGQCIFGHQIAFLRHGIPQLKTLKQIQISQKMDLSPSSVSRALAGKYAKTPQGTVPLVDLARDDLKKSSIYVIHYICTLMGESPGNYFLSNQKIADLIDEKFDIRFSRKTIARFRFTHF
ncbi:MAG: hypothetical protein LBI69_04855 [Puniceicoccales bacterium]|jgi:RNA polymerase sigma-54 factor|nr:hypothetical protein [Puniceicoccales bacterium]